MIFNNVNNKNGAINELGAKMDDWQLRRLGKGNNLKSLNEVLIIEVNQCINENGIKRAVNGLSISA